MAKAKKISISVDAEELKWLRQRARRRGGNLSAVIAEATRLLKQREARDRMLEWIGKDGQTTENEAAAIRATWRA